MTRDTRDPIDTIRPLLTALSDEMAERMVRRRTRRLVGGGALVLATAATVIGLLLVPPEREVAPPGPSGTDLNVESSRSFVVVPTSRDDITVIWLMEPE